MSDYSINPSQLLGRYSRHLVLMADVEDQWRVGRGYARQIILSLFSRPTLTSALAAIIVEGSIDLVWS